MIIVVMGVTGSGKTTIGRSLAERLGVAFVDGDDFHSPADMAQMAAGRPLTEAQRAPWLDRLHQALVRHAGDGAVCACSALTTASRARLLGDLDQVRLVWLHGDPALLAARIEARRGHPVGVALLPSQLNTLDPPIDAISIDVAASPLAIIERIAAALAASDRS